MKIVLLPLDERPCNSLFPKELPLNNEITLVTPPANLLSSKKQVCNIKALHQWLIKECRDADYALLSLDTLLYGGIVPSRIHHDRIGTLIRRSKTLSVLKRNNPKIKIFVNELIMRTPSYSNATEEPDYFDICGRELWEYGCLLDKEKRGIINDEEKAKMEELSSRIPKAYLNDLMKRRDINKRATIQNLRYILNGTIDYFIIPQDDCAPYGFTSIDRRDISAFLHENGLDNKVFMYPGADEAGMVLISRALNDYYKNTPKIFVKYASEEKKDVIPEYEDRSIDLSIFSHSFIVRAIRTYIYEEADLVLGVNLTTMPLNPGELSKEKKDELLTEFVNFLEKAHQDGKVVGISDVNICNRGDIDLFKKLSKKKMLDKIDAYAGWNTASNSTGTTIAMMMSYLYSKDENKKKYALLCRYAEDVFYMGPIRDTMNRDIWNSKGDDVTIENLSYRKDEFTKFVEDNLNKYLKEYDLSKVYDYKSLKIFFPWNRTFEIGLKVD